MRKPADGYDRASINVRTRVDLKERLEAIAAENGRSLAQEVELRLRASLTVEASPDLRAIIREEIRAALDVKDARELGGSLDEPRQRVSAEERRLYGPRPEVVRVLGNGQANHIVDYGPSMNCSPTQTYDRSALNGKQ